MGRLMTFRVTVAVYFENLMEPNVNCAERKYVILTFKLAVYTATCAYQ